MNVLSERGASPELVRSDEACGLTIMYSIVWDSISSLSSTKGLPAKNYLLKGGMSSLRSQRFASGATSH